MADALSPGQVVSETYEVERLLGRGGMGEVWLARHLRLSGKQVAIKVLHTKGEVSAETLRRFEQEALIAVRLEHPNIVQVTDFNRLPTGQPFIVMEYLKGESLAARVARGPLAPEAVSHVMRQVGSALQAAHGAGVIHRDLKPENIFLVPTGLGDVVKVLDFGISKLKGSGAEQTTDSVLMGTPRYMSPEQALGKNRDVSPASDVFSLGSIAYECLSGTAPFVDESIARVVFRIAYEPHAPLPSVAPGVPDAMARAVEHALQKDLAQRTPDVATFVLELTGQALSSVPRPALAPEGPRGAVAQAGTPVDESVMGGATVASSRGGTPVAAPAPAVVVLPAVATPPVGAHPPRAGGPPRLVVGAVLVVVVAVTTFLVARSLDGASERAGAGSGAPGASSGPGADAGVRLQPVELPDAGPAAVTPGDGGPEPDARPGAVAVSGDGGMDVGGGPDGGPGRADDAGVRLVRPVMRPPAVLEPPSPADLALLETLEARLAEGAWEEVWLRRAMASQFTSPAGRRDHAIMMTEVACKRGDLSGANGFFRQLPSGAARELAQRRCRKHRVDFTLE